MLKNLEKLGQPEDDLTNFGKTNRSQESEYFIMRDASSKKKDDSRERNSRNRNSSTAAGSQNPNRGGYIHEKFSEKFEQYEDEAEEEKHSPYERHRPSNSEADYQKDSSKFRIISK